MGLNNKFRDKISNCLLTQDYVIHIYKLLMNNNQTSYAFVLWLIFVQINDEKEIPKTSMNRMILESVLPNESTLLSVNDRERLSQDKRKVNFSMKTEGFKIERNTPSQNPLGMKDTDSMR